MRTADLLARFRDSVWDVEEPYLWSDTEILEYMNDAQEMFVRITGGISDASTAEICSLTATASTAFTDLDDRIIKIRSARRNSDGRFLELLNFEDIELGTAYTDDDYGMLFSRGKLDSTEGELKYAVLGMTDNKIRWYPIPSTTQTVDLIVYRMPLKEITSTATQLEVSSRHHIHLLPWMRYRAYMKADSETFDRGRAEENRQEFLRYCTDLAQNEDDKSKHKYRTVRYGGY